MEQTQNTQPQTKFNKPLTIGGIALALIIIGLFLVRTPKADAPSTTATSTTPSLSGNVVSSSTPISKGTIVKPASSATPTSSTKSGPVTSTGAGTSTITLVSPNGGEVSQIGRKGMVVWQTSGFIRSDYQIRISLGGGVIATTTPNDTSSYEVTIPSVISVGSSKDNLLPGMYRMSIALYDTNGKLLASDESKAAFTVLAPSSVGSSISIVSPNGGEAWLRNASQTITWLSSRYDRNVSIALITASPSTPSNSYTIASNIKSTGSFEWHNSALTFGGTFPDGKYIIEVCEVPPTGTTLNHQTMCGVSGGGVDIITAR